MSGPTTIEMPDAVLADRLDGLASQPSWAVERILMQEAARRLRRASPKVLAEAWGCVLADGSLLSREAGGPLLFASAHSARYCASRVVRVQIVEVPS